jgi:LysR family hydrogen peroxide-inducible transcriptional activator
LGDVERQLVGVDPFVLATPPGHPLGKQKRPVRPEQLDGENVLLLDDGHCFREQALSFCASARACELEFRATSLSTLVQMVASGAGVTLLPTLALGVETSRARLCIRPFSKPAPQRSVVLAWRKRSPLGPALSMLADTLRHAYAERAAG